MKCFNPPFFHFPPKRYKEEIVRLRRRYGEDDRQVVSPAPLTSKYTTRDQGRHYP